MNINYGYIRAENRTQYESLMTLKDSRGHYALSAAHRKIVEYVGSMPRAAGCFACEYTINEQSIRAKTKKTLKNHLKYLVHIKALSVSVEKEKRIFRIESVRGPVVSLKEFRVGEGMSEYAYVNGGSMSESKDVESVEKLDTSWFDEPVFFEKQAGNFAAKEAIFAAETANFAPILCNTTENSKRDLPPKGSLDNELQEFEQGGLLAARADAGETARPRSEGPPDPRVSESFKKDFQDKDWDEPLFGKKKTAKNQNERRVAAMKDHAAGHLVNPLGITNNRPKKLNAKLARDIGLVGSVTVPQLYRHLIKLYDNAFGEGIIAQMLPDDKSAITTWFGNVRQKFIDACKYEPTNRDVADYFSWILEPERAAKLLGASKYEKSNEKGLIHFKQMLGLAHVRKFYDQVLKRRLTADKLPHESEVTPEIEKIRGVVAEIESTYEEMKVAEKDPVEFVLSMINYGVAMGAQYLHENKSLSATECRSRIIHDMSEYLRRHPDKSRANNDLEIAIETAKRNRKLLDDECVWFEIEKFTDGMIQDVINYAQKGEDGKGQ